MASHLCLMHLQSFLDPSLALVVPLVYLHSALDRPVQRFSGFLRLHQLILCMLQVQL